jgi:hypothetical protein
MKWLHKFKSNKKEGRIFDIEYLDDVSGIRKVERVDIDVIMQKYKAVL